jgi:hypothetical protein
VESPQIGAVQPQQIECVQHGPATAATKLFELAFAFKVETDDLAIYDRIFGSQLR